MNRSTPGLPVHHQLPEFTQTHVHRVGDAIQPSHPLSSPSPPAPNPSQHQGLFPWVNSTCLLMSRLTNSEFSSPSLNRKLSFHYLSICPTVSHLYMSVLTPRMVAQCTWYRNWLIMGQMPGNAMFDNLTDYRDRYSSPKGTKIRDKQNQQMPITVGLPWIVTH